MTICRKKEALGFPSTFSTENRNISPLNHGAHHRPASPREDRGIIILYVFECICFVSNCCFGCGVWFWEIYFINGLDVYYKIFSNTMLESLRAR